MKSTKTVLAVAILIAGFAYAVGSAHPTFSDSLKHSHWCGPHPEDIRVYHVFVPELETTIVIPNVEGTNGFMLTDVIAHVNMTFFQDTGEGPVQILRIMTQDPISLTTGIPLVVGSTITTFTTSGIADTTLIGYVY